MDTLGRLSALFDKRDNFCVFPFAFQSTKLYLKTGTAVKRKYLIPFKVVPLSKGRTNNFNKVASPGSVSLIDSRKSFCDSFCLFCFMP